MFRRFPSLVAATLVLISSGILEAQEGLAPVVPLTPEVYQTGLPPRSSSNPCPQPCQPCPPATSPPSAVPGEPVAAPAPAPGGDQDFRRVGPVDYASYIGNAGAAGGLAAVTSVPTTGGSGSLTITSPGPTIKSFTSTPFILPGEFTATMTEGVVPIDRVAFTYGYEGGFRVASPTGGYTNGFNLNQFNLEVEKTFFDGMMSAYVVVPFLDATDEIGSLANQRISGLSDMVAGLKVALFSNTQTGSTLSMGFSVAAPTGPSTTVYNNFVTVGSQKQSISTTLNPTYLQPWIGGVYVLDRLFVEDYFGVIVPTDSRVSTLINESLNLGFQVYRGGQGDFVSSITPTLGFQVLLPVTHTSATTTDYAGESIGSSLVGQSLTSQNTLKPQDLAQLSRSSSGSFSDQFFLSAGVAVSLRERTIASLSVVVPMGSPPAFSAGVSFSLNYLY